MKHHVKALATAAYAAAVISFAGCASSPTAPASAGFLPGNLQMQEVQVPGVGGTRLQWVNPKFAAGQYSAVLLEPIQYYPEPQPNEYVSAQTLTELRNFANENWRQNAGARVKLASGPGPGVARLRVAVTAVGAQTESLAPYQFIPIGLAITGAMAAAQGGLPQDSKVAFEVLVTDSLTGEILFASVRGVTGQRLQEAGYSQRQLTVDDMKPLVNRWTAAAAAELATYVR